ncbi:unnamed protein product [Nesidiocoris tenuis]|uniref:Uncharacterized protein n=1 Tax=Nesidiocoris tenuis TaxID=355587 RepID=A0A6H5H716_9HEMI|nr:unnamed protein product [Nesidiocoris tenuis]
MKRKEKTKEDKRPRTAFSGEQLARLKTEFGLNRSNRTLTIVGEETGCLGQNQWCVDDIQYRGQPNFCGRSAPDRAELFSRPIFDPKESSDEKFPPVQKCWKFPKLSESVVSQPSIFNRSRDISEKRKKFEIFFKKVRISPSTKFQNQLSTIPGFRTLIVGADHCWSCGVQLQCPRGLDTQQQQQTLAIRQSRVAERDGTKKQSLGCPEEKTQNFGQWVKPISEFERTGASGSAGYPSATHVLTASASRSASRPVQSFLAIFPPPLGPVSPSPSRSSKLGISSLSRTENVVCGPECPPASLHVLLYLTGRPLVPLALVLAMPAPPSRQICAVFFIDLTGGESGSAGYADNVTCGTGCARIESPEAVESKFYF